MCDDTLPPAEGIGTKYPEVLPNLRRYPPMPEADAPPEEDEQWAPKIKP